MCYNTLARANLLMQDDEEKRDTINRFMDEEIDYSGEVEVLHFLNLIKKEVGWDKLREKVKFPLKDWKVAPYYGCTLHRPREVGIEPLGSFELMGGLLEALGATVIEFPAAAYCCGSYQVLGDTEATGSASAKILNAALSAGADMLATSCPLCEYNLGKRQDILTQEQKITKELPTFYFTQLLAIALGVNSEKCGFELNGTAAVNFLKEHSFP